jgi:Sec-independent protein translocase protein TatA
MNAIASGLVNLAGPDTIVIIGIIACVLLGPKLIKGWSRGIIDTVKEVNKAKKEITDDLKAGTEDVKAVINTDHKA